MQQCVILRNVKQAATGTPRATDRGLSLLREIADNPDGMALVELAREVGLNSSTALRQLRALEAAGFASRRKDGDWEPGPELLRIARSLVAHATLPRLAAPVLADIARATGESVYLAEPVDAGSAVYVAMEAGSYAIRHVSWLGRSVPRRGSAVGQALVGRVDDDGVIVVHDAVEAGVTAVAAPVRGMGGLIEAALSLVGPSFRLDGAALAAARRHVAGGAAALQSRLVGSAA
jgi:DNA-binding IclR family transcriptional regulator